MKTNGMIVKAIGWLINTAIIVTGAMYCIYGVWLQGQRIF